VTGVTARVPAKLNLQLAVGPPRADGYHDLVTVFHAVSLFDEITAEPAARDGVSVTGEGAEQVPGDHDNLALRAVTATVMLSPGWYSGLSSATSSMSGVSALASTYQPASKAARCPTRTR